MRLKKSKRLVSLLLAGSMMVSMVPASAVTAFAAEAKSGVVAFADTTEEVPTVEVSMSGGLEAAVREKYPNLDEITSLVVKGGPLNASDFQFLSGVVVKDENTAVWTGKDNIENISYLKNLTKLDLTDAQCTEDKIPLRAFNNNTEIKTIFLPTTLTSIGKASFANMTSLKYIGLRTGENGDKILFPTSLNEIGIAAFLGDTSLPTKLVIPAHIHTIGMNAFLSSNITSVEFEEGVTKVSAGMARICPLTSITIPNTVTSIGDSAFQHTKDDGNTFTNPIVIPASVASIERYAFSYAGNIDSIIIENPNVTMAAACLGEAKTTKLYFAAQKSKKDSEGHDIWNANAIVLNTDYGTIANSNGKVTAELDTTTNLYVPTKEGYKFLGWYTDVDDETTKLAGTAQAGKTYTAKWYKYTAEVNAEEKTNEAKINYVGSPIDIAVDVKAVEADITSITKTDLIFDDIDDIEKVEVNGKELAKPYTNIDFGSLMNQSVATLAMVPVTREPIIFSVTFKTPGEHTVKIVLKDDANNVICSQDTRVKVVAKPILTFSDDCNVTVNGNEVKTGTEVEIGADVTVKLAKDVNSGMKFGSYVIDPIPEKVEYNDTTATFAMPAKNTSITLHLDPADTEDDSWDAATVITGVAIGTGAAVLTYHIGTELYAEQVLGKGVAVPKTREDVALKAWELAGKPAVELNGEPLSEAAQAEKWAVGSGLMQNDAQGNFNGAKKMNKLKALRVLDAAKKMA